MPTTRTRWTPWLIALVGVAVLVGGGLYWREQRLIEENAQSQARQARQRERAQRVEEHWAGVEEESRGLMPDLLSGVRLGMRLDDARRARPAMTVPTGETPGEEGVRLMEERFPNGARAVYVFEDDSERLQRVQVLSLLPSLDAIEPHLTAMHERYGSPTGVWDCPDTGGVPTRRFTWRHGRTTVSDVFLVYGGRVSVTLYVAPTVVIARSLRMGRCHVITRDQLGQFPVATPTQMGVGVE